MSTAETPPKKPAATPAPKAATCQICGKVGGVVFDPEKPPPNRLGYRCAAEYGMQDPEDD